MSLFNIVNVLTTNQLLCPSTAENEIIMVCIGRSCWCTTTLIEHTLKIFKVCSIKTYLLAVMSFILELGVATHSLGVSIYSI